MNWDHFKRHYLSIESLNFAIDISHINFEPEFWTRFEPKIQKAFKAMSALEAGAIANPDENRMVGHYWLRADHLAPSKQISLDIQNNLAAIHSFAQKVHTGVLKGAAGTFKHILYIGIGGSTLGPQFVAHALGNPLKDKLTPHFIDNTDPDGIVYILDQLKGQLGATLVVVASKSGSTPEPRNAMLEVQHAYTSENLDFAQHALAITGIGSQLDQYASNHGWLARFPMWDWVGGRTSELAAVGLLPAALQGIDIDAFLKGAADMDIATRNTVTDQNPAALLALTWYQATGGAGKKSMVLLPYRDRLLLLSRYLQQLIMESLGKEKDIHGNTVHQGIQVYGNKGSTDQHAYVQQLRDGLSDFFVTFVQVLEGEHQNFEIEPGVTSQDYLQGFLQGTRAALYEKGRQSITLTIQSVSAHSIGMLIALYERAVGYYAHLIEINAYNQPGVEAGKQAAAGMLMLKKNVHSYLKAHPKEAFTAETIAKDLAIIEQTPLVFNILNDLAANGHKQVHTTTKTPFYLTEFYSL